MRTASECLPCFLRQTSSLARIANASDEQEEALLRAALSFLARADFQVPPTRVAQHLYPMLYERLGSADPYANIKTRTNQIASELATDLERRARDADDPFRFLVLLALAGNIIDFGVQVDFDLEPTIERVLFTTPAVDQISALRERADDAQHILYLADNAGEIAFDRLLIERGLAPEKVTVAVRGGPIINDATKVDAAQVGLDQLVDVVDPGIAVPGVWLEGSSREFQRIVHNADLIISKGQGNFETLHDHDDLPLFFLFMVKCSRVAAFMKLQLGDCVAGFQDTLRRAEHE